MKIMKADEYRILCEKEEMIVFMSNYAPYAPIRRITNGYNKGAYEIQLKPDDFQNAPYIREPFHEEWNEDIFKEQMKNVCAAWTFGESDIVYIRQAKLYSTDSSVGKIRFWFAENWTQFEPETTQEKPIERKRQPPRRKAPKMTRGSGALAGWTYNRLGTKQTKVLKW